MAVYDASGGEKGGNAMQITRLNAVLLALVLFAGCSGGPDSTAPPSDDVAAETPEQVAQAFFEAGSTGDKARFEQLMTAKAREGLNSGDSGFTLTENQYENVEVRTATATDTEATVPVDMTQDGEPQTMTLKMRQEDNAWRIYAAGMVVAPDMEITINFEEIGGLLEGMVQGMGEAISSGMQTAFRDAMQGGSEEERAAKKAAFEALAPIDEAAYTATWTNDVEFQGQTALAALETLAAELDLVIHPGEHKKALATTIQTKMRLTGQSRLRIIEHISAHAGLYPVYPTAGQGPGALVGAMAEAVTEGMTGLIESTMPGALDGETEPAPEEEPPWNAITFAKGPRPLPVAFTGPFIVEVIDLDENVPHATGNLRLAVKAFGLDPGLLALMTDSSERLVVSSLTNANGDGLRPNEDVRYYGGGTVTGSAYFESYSFDLKNLLRAVTTIDAVDATYTIALPTEILTAEFDSLAEGATQSVGVLTVTVKNAGGNYTQFDITGPEEQLVDLKAQLLPLDASGEMLGVLSQSVNKWNTGEAQADLNTHEVPASVRMKLITASKPLAYPINLRAIPLAHYAQMPEAIEQLAFESHDMPMTLRFVAFKDRESDFPKVDVEIINHSNKDALSASAKFMYRDASGKELEEFPHSLSGAYTPDGQQPVSLSAATTTVETTAFFMPDEADSIKIDLTRIEFIDGTTWENPQ